MATDYKIIFTGPVGAGKTTAIASISDIDAVRTDESASDMTVNRKKQTTVALDYGLLRLQGKGATDADRELRVHLYGTPGQERFEFMWDILTQGGTGLILLLDNTRPTPFVDLRFYLEAFRAFIKRSAVVVGVTQMDVRKTPTLEDYQRELIALDMNVPIMEIDARKREDVAVLVQALLLTVNPEMAAS